LTRPHTVTESNHGNRRCCADTRLFSSSTRPSGDRRPSAACLASDDGAVIAITRQIIGPAPQKVSTTHHRNNPTLTGAQRWHYRKELSGAHVSDHITDRTDITSTS
jgi:hypothetical protein